MRKILFKLRIAFHRLKVHSERPFWTGEVLIDNTVKVYQRLRINGSGKTVIGANTKLGFGLGPLFYEGCITLQARTKTSSIIIGDNCHINNNVYIAALKQVQIGSHCLIGDNVTIIDFDGHNTTLSCEKRIESAGRINEVIIGSNVWIGSGVKILQGTRIGDNCIVAAGSVLNKTYKANKYIGDVPAITFGDVKSD